MGIDEKNLKQPFPKRLQTAAKAWQNYTKDFLDKRQNLLKYYAAGFYGGANSQHILPLITRGVDIVVPYLTSQNPQVDVSSRVPELTPWANTTELALNHLLGEIQFSENTLRPAVFNAMFGMGCVKTGIMDSYRAEFAGYTHEIGQPYSDTVDDTDYIGDVAAKRREAFEFEGNRYYLPTDYAKEFFGKRFADHIKPSFTLHGENNPAEITDVKDYYKYNSLYEWTEFLDIWLPRENIMVTILPDGGISKFLRVVDWQGKEGGPYDCLTFRQFPETVYPIPPAWYWRLMDVMTNKLLAKMRNQAEREKNVVAYEAGAEADAETLKTAPDGSVVKVDNVDALKELNFGGTNEENYRWVEWIESQFSKQGGNLYTLGGRGPSAETLGQEQMMMQNASRIVDDMINQTYRFTKRIVNKLAWFLWTDPLIQIPVIKRVPGVANINVVFDQNAKEGDFYDFNFEIKPYSMQRYSPEMKGQMLMQFMTQWLIPLAPIAQQQGVTINIDAATRELADKLGIDISNIWKSGVPNAEEQMGPYMPQQGKVSPSAQGNDSAGASETSRMANSAQFQMSDRANKPSPPNK